MIWINTRWLTSDDLARVIASCFAPQPYFELMMQNHKNQESPWNNQIMLKHTQKSLQASKLHKSQTTTTHPLTGVKCRATSGAKKPWNIMWAPKNIKIHQETSGEILWTKTKDCACWLQFSYTIFTKCLCCIFPSLISPPMKGILYLRCNKEYPWIDLVKWEKVEDSPNMARGPHVKGSVHG